MNNEKIMTNEEIEQLVDVVSKIQAHKVEQSLLNSIDKKIKVIENAINKEIHDYIKKEVSKAKKRDRLYNEHAKQVEGYLKGFNAILEKKL